MLTRLIAHQIIKDPHKTEATCNFRHKVLPTDSDMAISLLDQLREAFTSRSPISGRFKVAAKDDQEQDETFQQMVSGYLVDPNDSRFVSFTREATEALSGEMKKQPLATGGYVIFAEYKYTKVAFLMTALLSTTAQPSFDDKLNLIASISLDLANLRHGSRIRLPGVKRNAQGVVEFISDRISEYFVNFIGCEPVVRPEVQGKVLYEELRKWVKSKNLGVDETSEVMGRAYVHVQEAREAGRPVTIASISHAIQPDEPKPLRDHLASDESELAGQFRAPSRETMKRFVRFAFSGEGLKLEFDRDPWANRITVNSPKRTMTITEVPEQLIAALKEGV